MSIILKHILRNIKKNKMRSLLIIVALTVATTVLILNITLPDEIVLKFGETLRSVFGKTDIRISTVEQFGIEDLEIGDEKITYSGFSQVEMVTSSNKVVAVYGVDIKTAKEMQLLGEDVPILNDNEVVITNKMSEEFGHKEGDILKVIFENKTYELKIAKIVREKGITSINIENEILFANINTVNNIKKIEKGKFETLYIDVNDDSKIKEFQEHFKEKNENYIIDLLVDEEAIREQCTMISSMMTIIVVMATIMIFFVVSSLNKIILAERIPVIGTFRSIGSTKGKMNAILVLENAVYGLVGGILGSILGNILNSKASTLFISISDVTLTEKTTSLSLGTMLIGILFAVILQIFITIKGITRTNKKPIKDIIFNSQNSRYKIRKIRTVVGIVMIISAILINWINAKSNMGLTIISLIMLFIGIANIVPFIIQIISKLIGDTFKKLGLSTAMVSVKNIGYNKMIISSSRLVVVALSLMLTIITASNSITILFNGFRHSTEGYDIIVQNVSNNAEKYDELTKLDDILGVRYMYYFADEQTTYNNGKKFNDYPIFLGEDDSVDYIKELDYKVKDLKDNEALIDEKFAYKNDISVGDILKIKLDTLNKELEYKVAGFADTSFFTSSRNVIVINLKEFLKENITDVPRQVHLLCTEGADLEKVKEEIKDEIKEVGIQVQTVEEYIRLQEEQIESIMSMFYIILGLAVVLSFIGIINNQIIGFMQRTKELAVLNSTCMSKGQIKKMLLIEIVVSNIIACTLAVLTALLSTGIIEKAMEGMSIYMDIVFEWSSILKFVGVMFVILLLTILIPFRKLKKMNIVTEIKYE